MKAITVTFHGPTNTKPAKYVTKDMDNNRIVMSANAATDLIGKYCQTPRTPKGFSQKIEDGYHAAALALCEYMSWGHNIIGGTQKEGVMVFVFNPESRRR